MHLVKIEALTRKNFAEFGEVISTQDHNFFHINQKNTARYHALCTTQVDAQGQVGISLFRHLKACDVPLQIAMLERHPHGSQAFIPMQGQKFLVVVAPAKDPETPDVAQIRAFLTDGSQGVNYRQGTWHHPLLTLSVPSDFAVIDRLGQGNNCQVHQFAQAVTISL